MIIGLVWGKFFVFKVAECILSVGGVVKLHSLGGEVMEKVGGGSRWMLEQCGGGFRGGQQHRRQLKMARRRRIIQSVYGLHIPNEMLASLNNLVNDRQGNFVCVLKNLIL